MSRFSHESEGPHLGSWTSCRGRTEERFIYNVKEEIEQGSEWYGEWRFSDDAAHVGPKGKRNGVSEKKIFQRGRKEGRGERAILWGGRREMDMVMETTLR